MTRSVRFAQWSVVACFGLLLSGCGPSDNSADTYPVKGKVTVDGTPLPAGQIVFEDIPRGINNVIPIVNGEYSGQVASGDLKAKVEKIEKTKNPMVPTEEIETPVSPPLKTDISVTIKAGSNTLPPIDITTAAP